MNRIDSDFDEYLAGLDTKTFSSSKKEIERTYRAVLKKTGLKRKTAGPKKVGRICLIAAAAVVCTAVSAAAAGFNVGELFRGYFEHDARAAADIPASAASLTQSQIAVLDKSGKTIEQSVTDNGMTVTLKAAVCDQSSAYLLLDVTAPEGTVLDRDDYSFIIKLAELDIDDVGNYSGSCELRLLKDNDPTDNKKSFVLEMGYSGFDMRGRTFHLELSDFSTLRQEKAEDYFTPVVKGDWTFDPITLQSDTATKELTVNQVTHFNSNAHSNAPADVGSKKAETSDQCTVDSISLSSFSAIVHFTGKDLKTKGDSFAVPNSLALNLKDGTKVDVPFCDGGSSYKTKAYYVWRFDEPVDVNSVSSVTLGDLTVPVS